MLGPEALPKLSLKENIFALLTLGLGCIFMIFGHVNKWVNL